MALFCERADRMTVKFINFTYPDVWTSPFLIAQSKDLVNVPLRREITDGRRKE